MSLSSESMLLLSAYADGELEGEERSAAEALVRERPDAEAFVASLGRLGHAVRAAVAVEAPPVIDLTDAIMGRIESTPAVASVVSLDAARRARRSRSYSVGMLVGALAVAAASVLFLKGRHIGPQASAPTAVAAVAERGVEVHDIDSDGERQVSVFYLPAGANVASSVVVWIDEKGAP